MKDFQGCWCKARLISLHPECGHEIVDLMWRILKPDTQELRNEVLQGEFMKWLKKLTGESLIQLHLQDKTFQGKQCILRYYRLIEQREIL